MEDWYVIAITTIGSLPPRCLGPTVRIYARTFGGEEGAWTVSRFNPNIVARKSWPKVQGRSGE
jgi:hypothetical protein